MRGRLGGLAVSALVVLAVPLSLMAPVAAQPVHTPSSKQQCMAGGWHSLTDEHGVSFRNQGQCVAWANHHPHTVGLADLAGTFAGTQAFDVPTGPAPCAFIHQTFDATYQGSPSVGTVTFHIDGCIVLTGVFGFAGDITLVTAVGTVSGQVAGPITGDPVAAYRFELTSSNLVGSGAFANLSSGTLGLTILWNSGGPSSGPISGSVAVI